MLPKIRCNADLSNGAKRGASADVAEIHYSYCPRIVNAAGDVDQVLTETEYDIECPNCGTRQQRVEVKATAHD
jgi:hypothetical protein